jgi:hypothetical protein
VADLRPPPRITVTVPGRGLAPAELLAVGPPPQRARPRTPLRLQALVLAALTVLGAGVAAAVEQESVPPAPRPVPQSGFPGVGAVGAVEQEREFAVRLALEVVVAGNGTGQGDTGGAAQPEQLLLVDAVSRGFQVRLVDRSTPLVLGQIGRFGSGRPYVVPLAAEAVVVDCSVEVGAQRRITLVLRRADGPARPVVVATGSELVRALDDLVRRTCRRPRG